MIVIGIHFTYVDYAYFSMSIIFIGGYCNYLNVTANEVNPKSTINVCDIHHACFQHMTPVHCYDR